MTSLWRVGVVVMMVVGSAVAAWAQEEDAAASGEAAANDEAALEEEAAAPEPQMSLDRVIDFSTNQQIALDAMVGGVEVRAVEFVVNDVKTGFMASPFKSGNEDLKAELTVRANLATTAEKKRKIGMLVELLDGDENVIDRTGNNIGFKDTSKIFTFKFSTLKWALERTEKVRLRIEARN